MRNDNSPPFECLDVLDDLAPRSAPLNMAMDEVLLGTVTHVPLLRIYRWTAPAVSFGYFTPADPVLATYPGREWVRRWTGGGIVEHGSDVTYSLLIPRSHPLTNRRAGESYGIIHAALQTACRQMGWGPTTLAQVDCGSSEVANRACFATPVHHDLLSEGNKIGGGAQRRTRQGLLHQGSVQPVAGLPINRSQFVNGLPAAFARRFQARPVRPEEEAAAGRLTAEKYATDRWLRRR